MDKLIDLHVASFFVFFLIKGAVEQFPMVIKMKNWQKYYYFETD